MRLNWLAALLVAAFACPWVIPAGPASAQALSVSDAASANQSALDAINDIFIGKNTRGPYVLSWNNVDPDSELIVVAGRKMSRGNDYTIDYPSGSIAFSESLPQGAVARATYRRIPGKSAANAGGISLPLSMRLLNSDRGNLDVMGFYRNSGNNSADQGIGAVGFGGGLKFGAGSEVTSTFLVSQGDDAKTGQKSSFADRSAIKLGTTTSIGGLAFKASFARAGEQFSGSKEYGLQQAKQFLDLAGTWGKTSDVVYASFSYKQQDNLAGAQKGLAQTSTDDKIALNLPTGSKLSVTHSASDNGLTGAAAKTSSNDSLQLDQAIGSKTTATALVQRSQVNTGKSLDETGMTRFGIQSTALSGASFHGNWQQKSSDTRLMIILL
jgi:hypothetical protein